jgi:hypothetical protein
MATHTIGTREDWLGAATVGAANGICLAAAPTFAIMALITSVLGHDSHDLFCAAVQGASPLSGMVWMYLLMSAFHSVPWLKLIAGWQNNAPRP